MASFDEHAVTKHDELWSEPHPVYRSFSQHGVVVEIQRESPFVRYDDLFVPVGFSVLRFGTRKSFHNDRPSIHCPLRNVQRHQQLVR